MINQIKYIFLIVVSVMLTTISSCSSRRMNKTKTVEQLAVKTTLSSELVNDSNYNKNITSFTSSNLDKYGITNNLDIEYDPIFDNKGNLIPFNYSRNENGNVTNVSISGNAKVKDTSTRQIIKETSEENFKYNERINALVKLINKQEQKINSLKRTDTKEVKVAPDYFKYIIWLAIGMLVLTAIIVVIYLYFKNTIGKYKKVIDKFV